MGKRREEVGGIQGKQVRVWGKSAVLTSLSFNTSKSWT